MPVPKSHHERRLISHHAHTAKILPGKHTSYPLLAVILLMVGVLLFTTTIRARADTVTVTAIANGVPPNEAAVILSPINNEHFTTSLLPVSGTCPVGFYVKLFRNDIFSGAAACASDGTFVIESDLFFGRNDLEARIFNIADVEGPRSDIVTVYYDILDPNAGGNAGAIPEGPAAIPFYLATDYFYKAAFTGQAIDWNFRAYGGTTPYTVRVIWGDGYSDTRTGINMQDFSLHHEYKSLKSQRDYFVVRVELTDMSGHKASMQLIAIMNDETVIGGASLKPDQPITMAYGSWLLGKLKYVWSAYGFVLLMGLCFWLGERRGSSITAAIYRKRRHV